MPSLRADVPGDHPRAFVTTTPKPIPLIREWAERKDGSIIQVRGSTYDNKANLSGMILKALEETYRGTLIGQQELEGVLLDAATGKIFSLADINLGRVTPQDVPELPWTVVGVDPGSTGEEDETGVVVVGQAANHSLYVLDDRTILGVGRDAAMHCWRVLAEHGARKLVVENTQGKRWVTETFTDAYVELRDDEGLFPAGSSPPLDTVDSKLSKKTRAEPVGMRCQQRRLHFVGHHKKLENQCVEFDPGDRDSPDRLDAMVNAARWLMRREPRRSSVVTPLSVAEAGRNGGSGLGSGTLRDLESLLVRW